MSQRISRWSETKPIGQTRTRSTPRAVQRVQLVEDVRAQPGLAGRARALKGERPGLEPGALGDQPRGLEELVLVGIALVENPRRQAVRREDDVPVEAAHPLGEHVEVRLVRSPALDEAQLGPARERRLQALPVAVDRQLRVVRRQHEADDRLRAAGQRLLDRVRDPRLPVLHPHEHGHAELGFQRRPLALGDLVERRAPSDPAVALGQLLDGGVRHGPPLADVLEVGPDVLDPLRAAVGHEDDGGLHAATFAVRSWTNSTSRLRSAGSVSGNTPWPRLKM